MYDGFRTWRKPSVLLFGANDPFVSTPSALDFLEDKRTNMKAVTVAAKVGGLKGAGLGPGAWCLEAGGWGRGAGGWGLEAYRGSGVIVTCGLPVGLPVAKVGRPRGGG